MNQHNLSMKKMAAFIWISLVGLLLASCSSTSLKDSWQAEDFSAKQFNHVLIVALTSDKSNRLMFENAFAETFSKKGIQATASHELIGTSYPTMEAVEAHVKKSEYDYMLVTKVGGIKVEKDYVAPKAVTYYTGPYYPRYHDYWHDYNTVTLTQEGYVDTRTDLMLTTTIYDMKTEEPVWIGRSETFDSSSVSKTGEDLSAQVVGKITN
jgi:hypothetical protein